MHIVVSELKIIFYGTSYKAPSSCNSWLVRGELTDGVYFFRTTRGNLSITKWIGSLASCPKTPKAQLLYYVKATQFQFNLEPIGNEWKGLTCVLVLELKLHGQAATCCLRSERNVKKRGYPSVETVHGWVDLRWSDNIIMPH